MNLFRAGFLLVCRFVDGILSGSLELSKQKGENVGLGVNFWEFVFENNQGQYLLINTCM